MRALVLSQYFWPENFRINELVTALDAKGIGVEVLTGKPNYPSGIVSDGFRSWGLSREFFNGVEVHRVPLIPRGKSSFQLLLNYLSFICSSLIFGTWSLRKRQFDIVFIFAPSPILQAIAGIWFGWIKKCPTVLWVQDLWPDKAVGRIVGWIYKKVDLLLVQSPGFISKVSSRAGKTPIVYYPNFFINEAPGSPTESTFYSFLDCDFPVVFAGNLGAAQSLEVMLEAAALLKNIEGIRFVIIGDGSRRDWLVDQTEKRGLNNVIFPGSYPIEAMPALLARAAVLLVTLADKEIFRLTIPSKIQAYLAAGRPIVACLSGAGADIVRESGAGLTVLAEDARGLADAVEALYRSPEGERAEMGLRGRKYFEKNFSQEKLVDELIGYFNQIASQQGRER